MSLGQQFPPAHPRKNSAPHPISLLSRAPRPSALQDGSLPSYSLPVAPVRRGGPRLEVRRSPESAVALAKAAGEGRSQSRKFQPPVPTARPNPPRINTSANSSFFIKSLIMNDLKFNRISKGDNKSSRINTSENYRCKPFRINTSRNMGGWGAPPQAAHPKPHFNFSVLSPASPAPSPVFGAAPRQSCRPKGAALQKAAPACRQAGGGRAGRFGMTSIVFHLRAAGAGGWASWKSSASGRGTGMAAGASAKFSST